MKFKLLIITLILAITLLPLLVSCDTTTENPEPLSRFERVLTERDEGFYIYYYRDIYTDVVYFQRYVPAGNATYGGLTVLLHADGTPILWSELERQVE